MYSLVSQQPLFVVAGVIFMGDTLGKILDQNLDREALEEALISNLDTIKLEKEVRTKKCCVCGEQAVDKNMSVMGQIPFYVCEFHKSLSSAMGNDGVNGVRMGLLDENKQWVHINLA